MPDEKKQEKQYHSNKAEKSGPAAGNIIIQHQGNENKVRNPMYQDGSSSQQQLVHSGSFAV